MEMSQGNSLITVLNKQKCLWCKYCVHMYVNGKMRLAETIPRMAGWGGGRRIKENDRGG
jgi:Fe-S-cluster-containing hydrogenase component 2